MQDDLSPSWEDWIDGGEERVELQGRERGQILSL